MKSRGQLLCWLLAAVVVLHAAWWAAVLPLTHDEGTTYVRGVLPGLRPFFALSFVDAANHLANTLLAIVSTRLFGYGEFALRIPNVAASVLFVAYGCRLASRLRVVPRVATLAVLCANPYLLNFFSLCRGYGLAIAFTMMSLFHALRLVSEEEPAGVRRRKWDVILAIGAAALSALSNLAWLYWYCALVASMLLLYGWARIRDRIAGPGIPYVLAVTAAMTGLLVVLVTPDIQKLRAVGALYYGGKNGFVRDTIGSVIDRAIAVQADPTVVLWMACALALFGAAALVLGLVWAARSRPRASRLLLPALTLAIVFLQAEAAYVLLGNLFPLDRAALYLHALFAWLGVVVVDEAVQQLGGNSRRLFAAAAVLCVLLLSVNTLAGVYRRSFHKYCTFDMDNKRVLAELDRLAPAGAKVRLGIDWYMEPSLNYYIARLYPDRFYPVDRSGYAGNHDFYKTNESWYDRFHTKLPREDHDYLFIFPENTGRVEAAKKVRLLDSFPVSGNVLLAVENP